MRMPAGSREFFRRLRERAGAWAVRCAAPLLAVLLLAACTSDEPPPAKKDTDTKPPPPVQCEVCEECAVCETDPVTACVRECGLVCEGDAACASVCLGACGTVPEPEDDLTPPETVIADGPPSPIDLTSATFTFSCNETACTFECRLNAGFWFGCYSPGTLDRLSSGENTFEVRAIDAAGNVDATPAFWTWTILSAGGPGGSPSWPVPDSGQQTCYGNAAVIACPAEGEPFAGQDAQHAAYPMSFTDAGDGTAIDAITGLVWQREDDDTARTWGDAVLYCSGLPLAGGGWRLPTSRELQSILDYGRAGPSIDLSVFPGTESAYYWTATSHAGDAESAWVVLFSYGYVGPLKKAEGDSAYVRCVR